ncbi:MAG: deoxyguanosinetriphosphate triphosphohydrolase [Elsteraceae bacterium]
MSNPRMTASYACDPARSRGRLIAERDDPERSCFQRDRDRIVHATAFRRLQYKTQVFVVHEGDHYRTRLTHSLEVAQIARSLARSLRLDEDLAEAVALAHDLGHTPFGHAGEEALNAAMKPFGGFEHNEQTLRVLTRLERRYAGFDGLNLSWETLEGVVKHNGPLNRPRPDILAYDALQKLDLNSWPGLEAQVAAMADDIAYTNHDIDDGLRAGLFSYEEVAALPLAGPSFETARSLFPDAEPARRVNEAVRRLMTFMISDLLATTRRELERLAPTDSDAVRAAGRAIVRFSDGLTDDLTAMRGFLFERMYRHYRVNRMTSKAKRVVRNLFDLFLAEPQTLPTFWRLQAQTVEGDPRARVIADYIAGMTDRFAVDEHRRLFDLSLIP